jgi:hypothetical protein
MNTVLLTHEAKMPNRDPESQIIVLFDEQGTPTFGADRETDWFLGVAVTYDLAREKKIFGACDGLFGLSNQKPLKNNRISNSRAERISALVIKLPIQTIVRSVNLADDKFQQVVTAYERRGNELRKEYRQVGERNIAQILHAQIVDDCVPKSIFQYIERHLTSCAVSVHMDNWSMSRDDIEIYLKYRTQSIQDKVNSFYDEQGPDLRAQIPPISLLDKDCPRKRLIDVITSAVSRSFLRKNSTRFSQVPLETLLKNHVNRYEDITQTTIDVIKLLMVLLPRNPPVG